MLWCPFLTQREWMMPASFFLCSLHFDLGKSTRVVFGVVRVTYRIFPCHPPETSLIVSKKSPADGTLQT